MRILSIKARITLFFTLMMTVLVAVIVVFMAIVGSYNPVRSSRQLLVDALNHNAREVDYDEGVVDVDELDYYRSGVYTLLYSADGELVVGAGKQDFPGDGDFLNGVIREVSLADGEYLICDMYVPNAGGDVWLRGIVPAENDSGAVKTLTILAIIVLPILLILTALGGWFIAGQAMRPVRRLTEAADAISDGSDLSGRIGLRRGRDEIHKLAATFDRMFERLERSFRAEKQFASDASHELRTPTTVILAECDYARRSARTTEDYIEAIDVIDRQAKKMSRLIDQLLGITRLEQGTERVTRKDIDVSALAAAACEESALISGAGFTLETDIQPEVTALADMALLSRVIENLLENARKYGGDWAKLSVRKEDGWVIIAVADHGPGIAAEDLPHIWQRFWRAEAARGGEGTGLGLYMVRQAAELHGGAVRCESQPGKGCVFTVRIPEK